MKNLAVVNALALSPYAETPLATGAGGPGESIRSGASRAFDAAGSSTDSSPAHGASALQRVEAYSRRLPGVDRAVLLVAGSRTLAPEAVEGFEIERLGDPSEGGLPPFLDLLRCLQRISIGYEAVFYVFGDCPLLDPVLSAAMLENHLKYFADYTFADGYPYGLAPEILKVGSLGPLIALAERSPAGGGEAEPPPPPTGATRCSS